MYSNQLLLSTVAMYILHTFLPAHLVSSPYSLHNSRLLRVLAVDRLQHLQSPRCWQILAIHVHCAQQYCFVANNCNLTKLALETLIVCCEFCYCWLQHCSPSTLTAILAAADGTTTNTTGSTDSAACAAASAVPTSELARLQNLADTPADSSKAVTDPTGPCGLLASALADLGLVANASIFLSEVTYLLVTDIHRPPSAMCSAPDARR
jgi:hypothetical protein